MRERALTVLAFTSSGWMRRFCVPHRAAVVLAAVQLGLTLMAPFLMAFTIWAGAELRRLLPMERENQVLTTQLRDQATLLRLLQNEMARLRELEKSLRAASGLADRRGPDAVSKRREGPCR